MTMMPRGRVTVIGGVSSVAGSGLGDFGFVSGMIPFSLNLVLDCSTALACFDPEKQFLRHHKTFQTLGCCCGSAVK
jgi:hypothetical protein